MAGFNRNRWQFSPEYAKTLTRQILERIDIAAFSFSVSGKNKGCTLDSLTGSYGYVKLQDALDENWKVYNFKTDELLGAYESIDNLIKDRWKVST